MLAGEPDEGGAGLVGPDHDHGVGLAAADVEQRPLHRDGVALIGALGDEFHPAALERPLDAREPGPAEGVVLVEDRDALDAEVLRQALDHGLGLLEIGGPDIDHRRLVRRAQELGPGEGADEGYAGLRRDRLRRRRGRRSDRPDEREHLVVVEKAAGRLDRPLRLVAVVPADELELAALDAAGPVHLAERGKQALPHAEPEGSGRTLEHGRLAEHDPLGKDAVVAGERRRRQRHGDDAEHGSGRPPRTHC